MQGYIKVLHYVMLFYEMWSAFVLIGSCATALPRFSPLSFPLLLPFLIPLHSSLLPSPTSSFPYPSSFLSFPPLLHFLSSFVVSLFFSFISFPLFFPLFPSSPSSFHFLLPLLYSLSLISFFLSFPLTSSLPPPLYSFFLSFLLSSLLPPPFSFPFLSLPPLLSFLSPLLSSLPSSHSFSLFLLSFPHSFDVHTHAPLSFFLSLSHTHTLSLTHMHTHKHTHTKTQAKEWARTKKPHLEKKIMDLDRKCQVLRGRIESELHEGILERHTWIRQNRRYDKTSVNFILFYLVYFRLIRL